MKTMRMIIGIISLVLFVIIMVQSCAAGLVDAIEGEGGTSGGSGIFVAIVMLVAGIIAIAARKSNGGTITAAVFYALGGIFGITSKGAYSDLIIWGVLCFIFAILFVISVVVGKKKIQEQPVAPVESMHNDSNN